MRRRAREGQEESGSPLLSESEAQIKEDTLLLLLSVG